LAQLHRPNGVRSIASAHSSQNLGPDCEETAAKGNSLMSSERSIGVDWLRAGCCIRLITPLVPKAKSSWPQ
jgi:hypothetical protein